MQSPLSMQGAPSDCWAYTTAPNVTAPSVYRNLKVSIEETGTALDCRLGGSTSYVGHTHMWATHVLASLT